MSKLYDRDEVSRTYFFPQPSDPLPTTEHAAPVRLTLTDETIIGGYWSRTLDGAPTILYLHGNGENIEHQLHHWPQWAEEAGANIFFVDYPGYATSTGSPTLTCCRLAAGAALDYLLEQPQQEVPKVVVMGRSVGTIFALDAIASRQSSRLVGLILESGIADLKRRLELRVPYERVGIDRKTINKELERDFDHQAKISELDVPVLIFHTRNDGLVPSWNSEQLAQWAGSRLDQLVLFEKGDHNTIQLLNKDPYREHLRRFIAAL